MNAIITDRKLLELRESTNAILVQMQAVARASRLEAHELEIGGNLGIALFITTLVDKLVAGGLPPHSLGPIQRAHAEALDRLREIAA